MKLLKNLRNNEEFLPFFFLQLGQRVCLGSERLSLSLLKVKKLLRQNISRVLALSSSLSMMNGFAVKHNKSRLPKSDRFSQSRETHCTLYKLRFHYEICFTRSEDFKEVKLAPTPHNQICDPALLRGLI